MEASHKQTDPPPVAADDPALLRSLAFRQLDEAVHRLTVLCMDALSAPPATPGPDTVRSVQRRRAALREIASRFVRDWQDLEDVADSLLVLTSAETRATLACLMSGDEYQSWLQATLRGLLTPT